MKRWLAASLALVFAVACQVVAPPNRPVTSCINDCLETAGRTCDERACERGCQFILDRLVEREGHTVVSCVAKNPKKTCDDPVWAHCAVLVGSHQDGGPPAPKPPDDDWE